MPSNRYESCHIYYNIYTLHHDCQCNEDTVLNLLDNVFNDMCSTLVIKHSISCNICQLYNVININDLIDQLDYCKKVIYLNKYNTIKQDIIHELQKQNNLNLRCPKCSNDYNNIICRPIECHELNPIFNNNNIDNIIKCDECDYIICTKCQIKYDTSYKSSNIKYIMNTLLTYFLIFVNYLTYIPLYIIQKLVSIFGIFIYANILMINILFVMLRSSDISLILISLIEISSLTNTSYHLINYLINISNFDIMINIISCIFLMIIITFVLLILNNYIDRKLILIKQIKNTEIYHNNKTCDNVREQINKSLKLYIIDTVKCPKCSDYNYIYNDFNNYYISCKCNHQFCHKCRKNWIGHNYYMCIINSVFMLHIDSTFIAAQQSARYTVARFFHT